MNDTIGKKIAKLRKKSKLTQEDLAQKLFVTDGTISKWETDKSVPDYETLKVLAKIFDVKINYFLEDTSIKGHLKRLINNIFKFIIDHWQRIIHIIITSFLLLYFIITYNSFQMYEMKIEDGNNVTFDTGYYIKSIPKHLYIEIEVLKDDNTIKQYSSKLSLQKVVDSKWIIHREKMVEIVNYQRNTLDYVDLSNSLINKSFEKIQDTEIYHKTYHYFTLYFDLNTFKMFYTIKDNKFDENIAYYYNNEILYYKKEMLKNENNNKIIEKFLYNNKEDVIECYIGDCDNYKEIYSNVVNIFSTVIE